MLVPALAACAARPTYGTPTDRTLDLDDATFEEEEVLDDVYEEEVAADEEQSVTEDPPGGAETYDYQRWNPGEDDMLSRFEFDLGLDRMFGAWDLDSDGELDDAEVRNGIWTTWDDNDNDALDGTEWAGVWFGVDSPWSSFDAWDLNTDGFVTRDEFLAGWDEAELFEQWDEDDDDTIAPAEFDIALWDAMDDDGDDRITRNEWLWR